MVNSRRPPLRDAADVAAAVPSETTNRAGTVTVGGAVEGALMELFRIIAIAAAPLGVVTAIAMSDGWWFLSGLIASLLLFLANGPAPGDGQPR